MYVIIMPPEARPVSDSIHSIHSPLCSVWVYVSSGRKRRSSQQLHAPLCPPTRLFLPAALCWAGHVEHIYKRNSFHSKRKLLGSVGGDIFPWSKCLLFILHNENIVDICTLNNIFNFTWALLIDGIQGGNNEVHLNERVAERGCCIIALMQDSQCAFDSLHRC